MAAISIDGPVGLRDRKTNVANKQTDQQKVIGLLASIPEAQGGKQTAWATPILPGGDGSCPSDLVDAILGFQKFWKAKGSLFVADGVVDPNKNSLKKLNALASGAPPAPPAPKPTAAKPLDIIVRFTGGPGGNRRDEEREKDLRRTLNTDAYLKTHNPIEAICFSGFREQEQFVDAAVADVVRRRGEIGQGVTIVIGSSAGGVSALKAAAKLSEKSVRLDYVGINDAAFFSNGTLNEVIFKPAFAIDLAGKVLGGKTIAADLRENFFQTAGHNMQSSLTTATGFVAHAEFHGPLAGFVNRDLGTHPRVLAVRAAFAAAGAAAAIPKVRDKFAAQVHKTAGGVAEGPIAERVAKLVKP